jgi:hypothetical protein
MTISSGFKTREAAYDWVRTQVAPPNRHYYEYEDPLVVWYKKGIYQSLIVAKKQRFNPPKTPGFTGVLFWLTLNSAELILAL